MPPPSPTRKISTPRLLLRSIHPSETPQFRLIRSNPVNNLFSAIPDPLTRERSLALGLTYAAEQGIIDLFVILKPSPSPSSNNHKYEEYENLKVGEGEGIVIGVMQIDAEDDEGRSEIGGYIHRPFTGLGYGSEAFAAVINYALTELEREEVVLECQARNLGFRGLMRSLGLEGLEGKGSAWMDGKGKGKGEEESVRWVFGVREWEGAKQDVGKR